MGVIFLSTSRRRGARTVKGPVTGLKYTITPYGTPVSDYDVAELLDMTAPPCCGENAPFGDEVKLFGVASATEAQMLNVPDEVLLAEPTSPPAKKKRTYKKRSKKEVDIPVVETITAPEEEEAQPEEVDLPEQESGEPEESGEKEDTVMEE